MDYSFMKFNNYNEYNKWNKKLKYNNIIKKELSSKEIISKYFYNWKLYTYKHLKNKFQLQIKDYLIKQKIKRIFKIWKIWARNKRTNKIRYEIGRELGDIKYNYIIQKEYFNKWKRFSKKKRRLFDWMDSFLLPDCKEVIVNDKIDEKFIIECILIIILVQNRLADDLYNKNKIKHFKNIFNQWRLYTKKKKHKKDYHVKLLLKYYVGRHKPKKTKEYIRKVENKVNRIPNHNVEYI